MPTERFFRLSEKKQKTIYDAAMQEFSRAPVDKASINRIIQHAQISRGSFYTYFPDKMDLLRYLTESELTGIEGVIADAIKDTGGDYFAVLNRIFEYLVTQSQRTTQMLDFLKNVMNNRDLLEMLGFPSSPPAPSKLSSEKSPLEHFYEHIDHSKFHFNDPNDYVALLEMGAAIMIVSVLCFYNYPDQLELIRHNFHTSLEILKNGCYKCGEETGGVKV